MYPIPMSPLGLREHSKWSRLQAGYSWQEYIHIFDMPDPLLWGSVIKEA